MSMRRPSSSKEDPGGRGLAFVLEVRPESPVELRRARREVPVVDGEVPRERHARLDVGHRLVDGVRSLVEHDARAVGPFDEAGRSEAGEGGVRGEGPSHSGGHRERIRHSVFHVHSFPTSGFRWRRRRAASKQCSSFQAPCAAVSVPLTDVKGCDAAALP